MPVCTRSSAWGGGEEGTIGEEGAVGDCDGDGRLQEAKIVAAHKTMRAIDVIIRLSRCSTILKLVM
jgi:hypothetical protein